MSSKVSLFKGNKVRSVLYKNEWWFAIVDVIAVLTESKDPQQYFKRLKSRDVELNEIILQGGVQFVPPLVLTMETSGGKQKVRAWNIRGLFRLIQSIPSKKAEPFKKWLAVLGHERIQEIEDPEIAMQRMRNIYMAKGYSKDWIEKRIRGIAIREGLTDEWKNRGATEQRDYAILTAEISKATFGMTPKEYRKYKKLERENLRDHMDDLELIFSMLGERATTEITKSQNSKGVPTLKEDAVEGGTIAGNARRALEHKTNKKVSIKKSFLNRLESESKKN